MKLPGGEEALVPREKIERYLLSSRHPKGRFKARMFREVGFESTEQLAEALCRIARHGEVSSEVRSAYGRKYVVDGVLRTPTGIRMSVRTVWIQERRSEGPRLVTAYPR